MKKIFALGLLASFFAVSFLLIPAMAIEGTTTMKTSELLSLANRKTYRLGIRGSLISPTSTLLVNKNSSFDIGLEFDAKLNENLDTGPRFGYSSFKNDQGAGLNADYSILRFGYGARIYVLSWGEYQSTHGFANLYFTGEVNYYTASKGSSVSLSAPSSYAGLGGQVGAGVEFAFGPNTGAFAEVDYLKTSIKASDSSANLPLNGYILAAGTRLAFF